MATFNAGNRRTIYGLGQTFLRRDDNLVMLQHDLCLTIAVVTGSLLVHHSCRVHRARTRKPRPWLQSNVDTRQMQQECWYNTCTTFRWRDHCFWQCYRRVPAHSYLTQTVTCDALNVRQPYTEWIEQPRTVVLCDNADIRRVPGGRGGPL